jgi:MOSC domain-containing protein YiiM
MRVVSVSINPIHGFSKNVVEQIDLLAGLGVVGDAHFGKTTQHRTAMAMNPAALNYRQVHLISCEFLSELNQKGFGILPGQLGENITTTGIGLVSLPKNTILQIGAAVKLLVEGTRQPCKLVEQFREGLTKEVVETDLDGSVVYKNGVMCTVLVGGTVTIDDVILINYPNQPFRKLTRV